MLNPTLQQTLQQDCKQSTDLRAQVGPFSTGILVKTEQGEFVVPVEDMQIGWNLRTAGSYEKKQLDGISKFCQSKNVLVVGAHIGSFAIPLARLARRVTAIEANPKSFELLEINLFLNKTTNCRPIRISASDRIETIEFLQSSVNTGGSKRKPKETWHYYFDDPKVILVEAMPLDELLANEEFDVITMDIEGSEYYALKGMQRILSRAQMLEIEFCTHHLKYAALVSIETFCDTFMRFFSFMRLSNGQLIEQPRMRAVLEEMYDKDIDDPGIIFLKQKPDLDTSQ